MKNCGLADVPPIVNYSLVDSFVRRRLWGGELLPRAVAPNDIERPLNLNWKAKRSGAYASYEQLKNDDG